jgi:hypothetical protein
MHTLQTFFGFRSLFQGAPAAAPAVAAPPRPSATYTVQSEADVIRGLEAVWADIDSDLSGLTVPPAVAGQLARCLTSALYPHQRQALAWMLSKEQPGPDALPPLYSLEAGRGTYLHSLTLHSYQRKPELTLGGMLCDDMGLGKSLVALALVLAHPPPGRVFEPPPPEAAAAAVESESTVTVLEAAEAAGGAATAPTERAVEAMAVPELKAELKLLRWPVSGKKSVLAERLREARAAPPAPGPVPTAAAASASASVLAVRAPTPTLIVCPLSVLSVWEGQVDAHVARGLCRVHVYHGPARTKLAAELTAADIVLVTYDTLANECSSESSAGAGASGGAGAGAGAGVSKKRARPALLEGIRWHRVILDEAHVIRNTKTSRYRACAQLDAAHRWCLTGTLCYTTLYYTTLYYTTVQYNTLL